MLANLSQSQTKIYGIPWSPKQALYPHAKIYLVSRLKTPAGRPRS